MHILLNRLLEILALFNILFFIGTSTALAIDETSSIEKSCAESCSENGICDMDDNDPKCYCFPGWMGPRCQQVRVKTGAQDIYSRWSEFSARAVKKCPSSIPPGLCLNGGSCFLDSTNELTCVCSDDYIGDLCDIKSPCPTGNTFCKNGGTCEPNSNPENPPKCLCPTGYRGFDCGIELMTTTAPPTTPLNEVCKFMTKYCKNGGTCEPDGATGVKCKCPPGYTGKQCDQQPGASPSQTTPPGPGQTTPPLGPGQTTPPPGPGQTTRPLGPGQTTPPPGPGQTNIPTGPAGITCDNKPCQNGRPCFNTGASYICHCGTQYTGINCETSVG